jgi:DNA-binding SARP family transcriptional activator
MAAEVRIWLLGGFRVEVDSRPVPDDAWRRNKAKAVVKLLALAPEHLKSRQEALELTAEPLWVDVQAAVDQFVTEGLAAARS